jgi:hypothetical protein
VTPDDIADRADRELDREERERLAGELDDSDARDHVLALGEAAVDLLPGAGALIGYVIREHIPKRRRQRMVEFVNKLNQAVAKMEARLDRDFVQGDEFADLTEDVLESIARRAADGKRGFYAAALVNTAGPSAPEEDERERMLDALGQLRPAHLRLLAIVASTRSLPEGSNLSAGGIEHNIMPRLPGVSQEQMRADWDDLERLKILASYPSGTMTRQGIEDLTVRMTDFGRRFVDWISLVDEMSSDGTT